MLHQYVDRSSRAIRDEIFVGNRSIRFIYSRLRENAPLMFRIVSSARTSRVLAFVSFSRMINETFNGSRNFLKAAGIDHKECVENPDRLDTPRKLFERKIRYWECRPMPNDPAAVVSPCDARMLAGSFDDSSGIFIKGKFFDFQELLGKNKTKWLTALESGDFAVFRLTPDRYHYTHTPVAGRVLDVYTIEGLYHACHPDAVVSLITPYSKNKRVVTIIDTDVPGGSQAGIVAMVEVVALMIGDIVSCYSDKEYRNPAKVGTGMFLEKGCPKSLFRPGSSTVVLIFQRRRLRFNDDIIWNMCLPGVESIFSRNFSQPLVETDIQVRSIIGTAVYGAAAMPDSPS
ncbi:MAG: phosphatidylserine decarboxylase [Syntrophus sp. PtaU1.Bin005]|jgi:phosphatidylserine decarboxylase|nr:MAG: phosphatidylserine decarboxylase [Syntrophus sp. PtaU1.Bin005]